MSRILDPLLEETLNTLGATQMDKLMLVGFLESQVNSAVGRVQGLRNSAADLNRQADQAELEAGALQAMLDKFTDEAPVEEGQPEGDPLGTP